MVLTSIPLLLFLSQYSYSWQEIPTFTAFKDSPLGSPSKRKVSQNLSDTLGNDSRYLSPRVKRYFRTVHFHVLKSFQGDLSTYFPLPQLALRSLGLSLG